MSIHKIHDKQGLKEIHIMPGNAADNAKVLRERKFWEAFYQMVGEHGLDGEEMDEAEIVMRRQWQKKGWL